MVAYISYPFLNGLFPNIYIIKEAHAVDTLRQSARQPFWLNLNACKTNNAHLGVIDAARVRLTAAIAT